MNKFFLTFNSPELEAEYQLTQSQQFSFKFYLMMIFTCLVLNIYILTTYFISPQSKTWQISAVFIVICMIQIIVFVIMKRQKYIQLAMTITNILLGFLQMNIDPKSNSNTEFYSYGNIFMQFQGIIYVISDFQYVVIQVIGHLLIRLTITITYSNHFDYMLLVLGIIAAIFISSSSYLRNQKSRLFFMQNLKDTYFDQISSFLINQPYFKITFCSHNNIFYVGQNNLLNKFPAYNEEYCQGCNVRNILRQYKVNESESLESQLILQIRDNYLNHPQCLNILYKRERIYLRLSQLDHATSSYIVILEQKQLNQPFNNEEQKLKKFLKKNSFYHQKFMAWGIFSLVLLNSRVLKKINLESFLKRLLHIYEKQIFPSINLQIVSLSESNIFCTFFHQFQIFLIQLYDSIAGLQQTHSANVTINLKNDEIWMKIVIIGDCAQLIKAKMDNNYFVNKISKMLLHKMIQSQNNLTFYLKKYSNDSFLHAET